MKEGDWLFVSFKLVTFSFFLAYSFLNKIKRGHIMKKKRLIFFILLICLSSPFLAFAKKNSKVSSENKEKEQDSFSKEKNKKTTLFDIGEIVVKDKAVSNLENASTSSEIWAEDIEARNEKLLADSLNMVPGIQIAEHRKGNKQFYLRGYDMANVALLIDGIPITDAYGGNMDIDNISVLNASKIVVNRGVSSALYGTKGVVGSINIITSKPKELYGEVQLEYGLTGNYLINVAQGAPLGKFYYYLTGSYDKSNGYEVSGDLSKAQKEEFLLKYSRYDLFTKPNSTETYQLSDFATNEAIQSYLNDTGKKDYVEHKKYKFSGKLGYQINSAMETGLSASYNKTEKRNSSYFSSMTSEYDPEQGAWSNPLSTDVLGNMSTHWPEYYTYTLSPYFNWQTDFFSLKANAFIYEQSNNLEAFQDPYENIPKWGTVLAGTWSIWTSQSYGINLFPSYYFSKNNKLNGALSFRVDNHKQEEEAKDGATQVIEVFGTDRFETQFVEAQTVTLAIEDEMKLWEKLEMTLGISYDMQNLTSLEKRTESGVYAYKYTTSDYMADQYKAQDDSMLLGTRDAFNPVLGLLYEPLKHFLKFRGAVSYKTKFPSLEAYSKTVALSDDPGSKESVDTKIKSEKSINGNLGFEISFLKRKMSFRSDYFYSKYDDKIERLWDSETLDHRFVNIDSALIHGVENSLTGAFPQVANLVDLTGTLSYTYLHARNKANTEDTSIKKGDKFEKTPEHQFIFDFRSNFKTGTSLNVFGTYTFNQIVYVMKAVPETDDPFSTSYYKEEDLHNPFKLNLKISQNIIDHFDVYLMCENVLDDYEADVFNPGPGRIWFLGLKGKI